MSPSPGFFLPLLILVPLWLLGVVGVIWLGLRSSKARGPAALVLVLLGLLALIAGGAGVLWLSLDADRQAEQQREAALELR